MFRNQILVGSIILIVVIYMSMWCSCSTYTPYSESSIYSKQYAYEGFNAGEEEDEEEGKAGFEGAVPEEEEEEEKMDGFEDMNKKVEGFESLHPAPYQQSELLDKFSQVPGKLDCQGYGYHNSRGPLCLTDDLVKSLKTRGGNASGKPDSLGK
jgi:hypothetical protein